ncbi:unnamed protein product [Thlaspi arvense]|uniref:Phylloplanin n=1 Tax=Thlaspi arvense TaxID=13288 RepID=A0AAU9S1P8_THLAR|nr:unnamed protein product [Thlaspi arvense]
MGEDTLSQPQLKSNIQKKSISYIQLSPKNMTMLKNKHITFSLILVCLIVMSPMAQAQLGGLGGLLSGLGGLGGLLGGLGGGGGGGGLGDLSGLLGLITIRGNVRCSVNGNASAPAFPNAGVQLQCGGNVVSASTTNGAGIFAILVNPVQILLSSLLSDCQLAVTTPLSTCNASLPTGQLLSPLTTVGNIVSGILRIVTLGPTGFLLGN